MIGRFEVGFETKFLSFYFGRYHYCYFIEEDAGKVFIIIKLFNKQLYIYEGFNSLLTRIWIYLIKKIGYI